MRMSYDDEGHGGAAGFVGVLLRPGDFADSRVGVRSVTVVFSFLGIFAGIVAPFVRRYGKAGAASLPAEPPC